MKRPKIALVGAGMIGGTLAHLIMRNGLADAVLIDAVESLAEGKALDIRQAAAIENRHLELAGGGFDLLEDSLVVIVTAGVARKPGMSRDDLLNINGKVMRDVGQAIARHCPQAFVICVTNPLDVMVWALREACALPHRMVVGMAGVLDSARFRCFLAEKLKVAVEDVHTFVLGGHGDSMVPLVRYTTVAGIPLPDIMRMGWLDQAELDQLIVRTRGGGGEIVALLKTGSAFVAPAHAALSMATAYLHDERRILPCAAHLRGEYGVEDLYVGVPVIIGGGGVEQVVELALTEGEQREFSTSVAGVRKLIEEFKSGGH